jgi:hypothetical protein
VIATDVLRELVATLAPIADERSRVLLDELRIADDTELSLSVDLELPSGLVAPVADALRSIDLAWRLAGYLAAFEESRMPLGAQVSLDESMPAERFGLSIVDVEVGSFRGRVKATARSMRHVVVFVQLVAALSTASTGVAKGAHVVFGHGTRPDGTSCQAQVTGDLKEPLTEVIKSELGELPKGCVLNIEVRTPDGAHIRMRIVKQV